MLARVNKICDSRMTNPVGRQALFRLLVMAAVGIPMFPAVAQTGPVALLSRSMTLMVPFSPGGPVDVLGRLLAQEFQAKTGDSVVVENRTGGPGNIDIDAVRKAEPDGSNLQPAISRSIRH